MQTSRLFRRFRCCAAAMGMVAAFFSANLRHALAAVPAVSRRSHAITWSSKSRRAVVEAATAYCFRAYGGTNDRKPWVCDTGWSDPILAAWMTRHGIGRSSSSGTASGGGLPLWAKSVPINPRTHWPERFILLSINTVDRISSHRARVGVWLYCDFTSDAITEALGTISVENVKGHWRVDREHSKFEVGE